MEIKAGYKNTEVGVIPSDWEVKTLIHVLNEIADVDHYMPQSSNIGVPYIMTGDLKELLSDIDFDNCKKISKEDFQKLSKKIKSSIGDVILARYATIGTVSYVDINYDFVISYSCVTVKVNTSKILGIFLFYYFKSNIFKIEARNIINANIQGNLGIGDLKTIKIALPSLTEQTAIATVLSDTDTLISSIEKLIAKKRNIKQGTMKKLLQPKKGWEVKKLWDFLDYEQPTEYLVSDTEYNDNNQIPVLTAGKTFILGYTSEEQGIFKNLPVIIFDDFTTAVKYVDFPFKVKSSAMKMLLPKDKTVNLRFIFEIMLQIKYQVADHKRHWIGEYSKLDIVVPKTSEEQNAIATILADMDTEIAALETKLEKYKKLKLGMMQNLLTGKIRLI
ncbi:MAG: restriction endonuclease subunit S [Bacteroidales bacterium]|nr:restriction endonuclease subunit S [Bacteroidales bacterium]